MIKGTTTVVMMIMRMIVKVQVIMTMAMVITAKRNHRGYLS